MQYALYLRGPQDNNLSYNNQITFQELFNQIKPYIKENSIVNMQKKSSISATVIEIIQHKDIIVLILPIESVQNILKCI